MYKKLLKLIGDRPRFIKCVNLINKGRAQLLIIIILTVIIEYNNKFDEIAYLKQKAIEIICCCLLKYSNFLRLKEMY